MNLGRDYDDWGVDTVAVELAKRQIEPPHGSHSAVEVIKAFDTSADRRVLAALQLQSRESIDTTLHGYGGGVLLAFVQELGLRNLEGEEDHYVRFGIRQQLLAQARPAPAQAPRPPTNSHMSHRAYPKSRHQPVEMRQLRKLHIIDATDILKKIKDKHELIGLFESVRNPNEDQQIDFELISTDRIREKLIKYLRRCASRN